MSDQSAITWTDATWNPVTGCSKVSPGCQHCYAERLSHRYGWTRAPWTAPHAAVNVVCHPDRLLTPLRWTRPRQIFVNSMSDLFHDQVPPAFLNQVFAAMALCYEPTGSPRTPWRPRHIFQVLTKRPRRLRQYLTALRAGVPVTGPADASTPFAHAVRTLTPDPGRLRVPDALARASQWVRDGFPGLWVGVSVEDQRRADERIPDLLATPGDVHFLSCEPLLGPVDLSAFPPFDGTCFCQDQPDGCCPRRAAGCPQTALDWVIAGAESGPNARPLDDAWIRSLRDACAAAGVPFFFKQRAHQGRKLIHPVLDGRRWEEQPHPPWTVRAPQPACPPDGASALG